MSASAAQALVAGYDNIEAAVWSAYRLLHDAG
jgi:hypothetical protein